ncbi:hypothetical protein HII31_02569 [Pseudocercospora fuligena]|uniref:DUF7730 domain-containing protein n=1 Tax=Pseudocercospora fuligena TaxID=685502 RepID=A0A8H6VKV1_9PEZI|nr:hypothetical protein HII31_02569 [Pseudocercospora fuligena]
MAFLTTSACGKPVPHQHKPSASFFDLSAELRNQIYRLALCADTSSGEYLNVQAIYDLKQFMLYVEHPCRPTRLPANYHLSPNLLVSCKQIQAESISILYGENAFAMCVSTFLRFKDQIRPFAKYVRFLKLELDAQETFTLSRSSDTGYTSAAAFNVGEALEVVEQLSELRVLELELTMNPRNGGVEHIAKYLQPVLKYLLRDEKDLSKVREVLKLSFRLPSSVQMEDYEDTWERAEEMLEEVYKALEDVVEAKGADSRGA